MATNTQIKQIHLNISVHLYSLFIPFDVVKTLAFISIGNKHDQRQHGADILTSESDAGTNVITYVS